MIETILIFAFGFLLASLTALLLLPAVNARAGRLARRRMATLFPLTGVEAAAEKDYLRAQFAVERTRMEQRMQAVGATKHADMATIGVRTLEAAALARTVSEREALITVREGEIAAVRSERDGIAGDLATSRSDLAVGVATLGILEEAHRTLLDELLLSRRRPQPREAAPQDSDAQDHEAQDHEAQDLEAPATNRDATARSYGPFPVATLEPATDPQMRIAELAAECEALRARLAVAEAATGHAGTGIEAQNAALRESIVAVAEALVRSERLPSVAAFTMPGPATRSSPP
ncbi:hypothetical protein [Methylobacterium sp. Leaf108]|uniref:hypothetical protein n=1 Tax=Methylobacterium sp. Leaf108 TaxID=1736256 RepID=UPI0006F2F6CB|nr:hypothetical protein [Methylobacterium sp. Leaf108]KQP51818.1 hypothetical protein ASF39_08610 [Methylobacterium sp. Leaf108]